ncbi:threonine ammonia-lyase [Rhodoplanes roseus]|uniref:Pyridoxal-5'-phosphate-dependent protein n=1 Tax=Rhodoplanes roseus TaxID=29409 RepID=A0A327KIW5_9BRAD|nr:threonine/serine dehydratase [Rhodoplanes roseus]RAI38034.1 pyridoxal-5'-phosphate-dependent protein [Rhodoplanes roseus]
MTATAPESSAALPPSPTVADIEAAAARLAGVAVRTPLLASPLLDARTGGRVFLKPETLQRTGSFKFRGAYNTCASIPPEKRAAGVVAFSSGNHAQGVAAAAQLLGMPATIVMPADSPKSKQLRTAGYGAEVVLYDRVREDREAIARKIATERGAFVVPPYDHPLVVAGQGTVGREIIIDLEQQGLLPDIVLVNASGGGLTAGTAIAVKAKAPNAQVYTSEPAGFDDYARSLASGKRERNAAMSGSICDALLMPTPGEFTFPLNLAMGVAGVVATDEEVARAVAFAFHELKLVVEPGGAVGLAALLAGKVEARDKVVVIVLSGGNVDADVFSRLIAS